MAAVPTRAECRDRIAGELHDLVAHQVSIVTIQAHAAQSLLRRDPEAAAEALAAVRTTAREALGDVMRLREVLLP